MVLFDIRTDDSHTGFIEAVNRELDSQPDNAYLSRFGHVASPRWWACFDRGEIRSEILRGEVTHVGPRQDWCDELEDVIEITCYDSETIGDRIEHGAGEDTLHRVGTACPPDSTRDAAIAYDRLDYWAEHAIRVGDRVTIVRTLAELSTRTGPIQYIIDLRAEWFAAHGSPTAS